jgi:Fe-S oxidoreductase
MSCANLAKRYALLTGNTIPESNASKQEQKNWLLSSKWTCTKAGSSEIEPDPTKCPAVATSNLLLRAKKNVLYETGFLAWINEAGMKCINQVAGAFYGRMDNPNLVQGQGEMADQTLSQFSSKTSDGSSLNQTHYCNVACRAVTANPNDPCLDCVTNVLTNFNQESRPVQLCPNITSRLQVGQSLYDYMSECLTCQNCIAQQIAKIRIADMTPDEIQDARQNAALSCITGSATYNPNPFQITTLFIVGMVLAGLLIMGIIASIIWIRKDIKKNKNIKNNFFNQQNPNNNNNFQFQ